MPYFLLSVVLALVILSLDTFDQVQPASVQTNYFEHDQQTTDQTSKITGVGTAQTWWQASDLPTCSCPPSCDHTLPDPWSCRQADQKTITKCNSRLICSPRAPIIQGYTRHASNASQRQRFLRFTKHGLIRWAYGRAGDQPSTDQSRNPSRSTPCPSFIRKIQCLERQRQTLKSTPCPTAGFFDAVLWGQLIWVIAAVPAPPSEKSTVYLSYKRFPATSINKKTGY